MSNEYRKKPVVIQAVQFTEELRDSILFDKQPCPAGVIAAGSHTHPGTRKVWSADFYIETLEGRMRVEVGDWIITGVAGEHYPCKPDIFAATYEPATLTTPQEDMSNEKMREEFEAWAARCGYGTDRSFDTGAYIDRGAGHAWNAWQAALATQRQAEPVALLHHDGEVADMATNEAQHAYLLSLPSGAKLYTAPPSAGNRTHIADLIDTFEQLRKIVGTPEQDADALIAAVRALATPPSAQQATGSGQVLTDERIRELWIEHGLDECAPEGFARIIEREALAAAAQAQPEDVPQKPDYQGFARAILAVLPGSDTSAAPTTGKREPLPSTGELQDILRSTGYVTSWQACEMTDLLAARLGITGEQR